MASWFGSMMIVGEFILIDHHSLNNIPSLHSYLSKLWNLYWRSIQWKINHHSTTHSEEIELREASHFFSLFNLLSRQSITSTPIGLGCTQGQWYRQMSACSVEVPEIHKFITPWLHTKIEQGKFTIVLYGKKKKKKKKKKQPPHTKTKKILIVKTQTK